ncbi:MAG: hypothetical protein IJR28_04165 [Ottowia sp.]|nr:hypothetical protein [Ottowia sp.]
MREIFGGLRMRFGKTDNFPIAAFEARAKARFAGAAGGLQCKNPDEHGSHDGGKPFQRVVPIFKKMCNKYGGSRQSRKQGSGAVQGFAAVARALLVSMEVKKQGRRKYRHAEPCKQRERGKGF